MTVGSRIVPRSEVVIDFIRGGMLTRGRGGNRFNDSSKDTVTTISEPFSGITSAVISAGAPTAAAQHYDR